MSGYEERAVLLGTGLEEHLAARLNLEPVSFRTREGGGTALIQIAEGLLLIANTMVWGWNVLLIANTMVWGWNASLLFW